MKVISQLKLAILVNWKEEGHWPFPAQLRQKVQSVDILQQLSFKIPFSGRLNYISKYLSEFYIPLLALIQRQRFDVIVSWQMRIGVCYGLLKRLCHFNKLPVHIIQDFHIDLTQTRGLYRLKLALLKLAIPGIDFFFCTSTEEEAIYSQMFNIPRNRIAFLPLVQAASIFEETSYPKKDYIFSFGNSDRDFDTLIQAVTPLNFNTYILSQKYKPKIPVPANVFIMREYVSDKEMIQWIASSRMVILPIKDYQVSAGQFSMLEVMALARPLIITENLCAKEYLVHQHSALFFKARSDKELADHIRYLWNHRESAEQLGQEARQAALKLGDKRMTAFINLLDICAMDLQKGKH